MRCCGPRTTARSAEQLERAREAVRMLLPIIGKGYELIVVHGNGPQVGNILIQAEEAADKVPPQTLDFCVAQTEGSMGFLLELAFDNELPRAGFRKQVVTIMTQVEVDAADPAFQKPSKPIGPFFSKEQRRGAAEDRGLDDGRGRGARLAQGRRRRPSPGKCGASRSRRRSSTAATSSSRRAAAAFRSSSPTTARCAASRP